MCYNRRQTNSEMRSERIIAKGIEVQAGGRHDDINLQFLTGFQLDAGLDEGLNLIGDDGDVAESVDHDLNSSQSHRRRLTPDR